MMQPTEKPPSQGVNCGEKIDEALWEKMPCLPDVGAVTRFFHELEKQEAEEFSLAFLEKDGLIHTKATYYKRTANDWAEIVVCARQTTPVLRLIRTPPERKSEKALAPFFVIWTTHLAESGGENYLRLRVKNDRAP